MDVCVFVLEEKAGHMIDILVFDVEGRNLKMRKGWQSKGDIIVLYFTLSCF